MALIPTGNGVFDHTVKMVGDRRMVLDMPHIQSQGRQTQLAVGHALLSKVRFGYHADKVRLVLIWPAGRAQRHLSRRPGWFSCEPRVCAHQ